MKVLFIIPPAETYIGASAHESVTRRRESRPQLGILYVASHLKSERPDIQLEVVDCPSRGIGYDELGEIVRLARPNMVALTSLTFTYVDTVKTSALIKTIDPAIKICVGGMHPTLYPAATLSQKTIDYVIIGEGEFTFLELLSCLESKRSIHGVKGLGFKESGSIRINEAREPINNLDSLHFPDYDLVDIEHYSHVLGVGKITLSIQTSRGCPFSCAFCDIRKTRYRCRSAESIVTELERWVSRGIHSFFFVDDNFVLSRERVIRVCKMIIQRQWTIDFKISSRSDTLDDEMMTYLKKAGCSRISLGIESCHQKYLDYLEKGTSKEKVVAVVEKAHCVGLPVFAYVIIGFPGETWEEMTEEVQFLRKLGIEYASFSLLTPYPKTALYERELKRGTLGGDVWQEFAENPNASFVTPFINGKYTLGQLRDFQHKLTVQFYFNRASIVNRIRELKSVDQFARYSKMACNILFRK